MLLSACALANPPPALTPITIQLQWSHSAQFAGLYAADQNGYYAGEGLAITFIEAISTDDRLAPVLAGKAKFGIEGTPALILARAEENDSMSASIPLINTGEDQIGCIQPTVWDGMVKTLRDQDVLTKPLNPRDVYTLQFVQELYGNGSGT
jgi:hypothetical protein